MTEQVWCADNEGGLVVAVTGVGGWWRHMWLRRYYCQSVIEHKWRQECGGRDSTSITTSLSLSLSLACFRFQVERCD